MWERFEVAYEDNIFYFSAFFFSPAVHVLKGSLHKAVRSFGIVWCSSPEHEYGKKQP